VLLNKPEEQKLELVYEDVYDESQAFSRLNMYIEKLEFIADSTLMLITADSEIRLLSTQLFHPETYDPHRVKLDQSKALKQGPAKQSAKPQFAEVEHGLFLPNPLKQENQGVFNQTVKFF